MAFTPSQLLLNIRNAQIGNICFQWAHLEYLLALTISSLLRLDSETAFILTNGLDILPRANMALKLAQHLKAPRQTVDALKRVRGALQDDLLERRNRAIHGHRAVDPNDFVTEHVVVHRGKGAGIKHSQTHETLLQTGRDIAAASKDLHAAMLESGVYHAACSRPASIIAKNTARRVDPRDSPSRS